MRTFAKGIVLWCNGSTTGFGSVCGGSNPPRTTKRSSSQGELLFFMSFSAQDIGLRSSNKTIVNPKEVPEKPYINNNVNKPKNAAIKIGSECKGTILRKRCQGFCVFFVVGLLFLFGGVSLCYIYNKV